MTIFTLFPHGSMQCLQEHTQAEAEQFVPTNNQDHDCCPCLILELAQTHKPVK